MKSTVLFSIGILLAMHAFSLAAFGSLGGDSTSVRDDQMKMQGSLRTTNNETYNVNEIQAENGVTVREFVSPSGNVFGVAWQGRRHPDLQQVLGPYYDRYVQAVKAQRLQRRGHGPLVIQEPGLVVQTGGHMRSLTGRAYLPQNIPAGVHAEDIQ